MNNLKKALTKVYNVFISNRKQFLILGLLYLIIFFIFKSSFIPFNTKLTQGFEMIDNAKMNNAIIKNIIISLVGLSIISSWLLCIHNFFSSGLIILVGHPELNYSQIIKKTFKSFWKIFGFSVLEFFIITFGLILFLIPGIYFLFVFYFALPIMINENLSIFKAIKKAKNVLKHRTWKKISLIILSKIVLFLAMIIFSIISLDGIAMIADWFISNLLIYQLIYNEDEVIENQEKLIAENE